ncbi:ATP-binding protein [Candidatus Protochlamydia phocaeensis]|uniref:ATP-binding protein n=1 Tax=Candidatus Protochlamydia phocaeensis TaxID=1414722 RepID=UPI00083962B2|nr:ATP-binding protein [Candidatus Protochlamydia phocaeensis]
MTVPIANLVSSPLTHDFKTSLFLGCWKNAGRQVSLYHSDQNLWAFIQYSDGSRHTLSTKDWTLNDFIKLAFPEENLANADQLISKVKAIAEKNLFQVMLCYNVVMEKYKEKLTLRPLKEKEAIHQAIHRMKDEQKNWLYSLIEADLSSYLPLESDQKEFKFTLDLYKEEDAFFASLLRFSTEKPSGKCSVVKLALCAFSYEALGKIEQAVNGYFALFHYHYVLRDEKAAASCLLKAVSLIDSAGSDLEWAHFLEKIPREDLIQLADIYPEPRLNQLILQKDAVRLSFEECLRAFELPSSQRQTNCFISFYEKDETIQTWLTSSLIPDLEKAGIETLSALGYIGLREIYKEPVGVSELIRKSDQVLLLCTTEMKTICDQYNKTFNGMTQQIRLAKERWKDIKSIFALVLKGNKDTAVPFGFLDLIMPCEEDIFSHYYINLFKLLASMRGILTQELNQLSERFASQANMIKKGVIDTAAVAKWKEEQAAWKKKAVDQSINRVADKIQTFVVPSSAGHFIGREKELEKITQLVANQSASRICLTGMAGVGKSELASQYAHRYRTQYDFIYTIKADSCDSLIQSFLALANELNIPSGNTEERLKWLKSTLEKWSISYLLILDGMNTHAVFEMLSKYLPNRNGCLLLTSRLPEYSRLLEFELIQIQSFTTSEATQYLKEFYLHADEKEISRLIHYFKGHPFALHLAVEYMQAHSLTVRAFNDHVTQYGIKIFEDSIDQTGGHSNKLLSLWNTSLQEIQKESIMPTKLLYFLSFFGEEAIPLKMIGHWQETYYSSYICLDVSCWIKDLLDYSLMHSPAPNSFVIPPLLQSLMLHYLSIEERYETAIQASRLILTFRPSQKGNSRLLQFSSSHCKAIAQHLSSLKRSFVEEDNQWKTLDGLQKDLESLL